MAYFHCLIQQGGGSGIPLVVTCASAFAGLTITCTDGTTTLTDTCPSSSPYEITFNLPNTGTWTVSGTISSTTYTESVLVEEFDCELMNEIDLTVDVYSAANDTVSYTGLDSQTHTITTDSSGYAEATIRIIPNGTELTFTSSVGKNPTSLSSSFSRTITLTSATTAIYVMPVDGDKVVYWYGYKSSSVTISSNSGCSSTKNTNDISSKSTGSSQRNQNLGGAVVMDGVTKVHAIAIPSLQSGGGMMLGVHTRVNYGDNAPQAWTVPGVSLTAGTTQHIVNTLSSTLTGTYYPLMYINAANTNSSTKTYAIWAE